MITEDSANMDADHSDDDAICASDCARESNGGVGMIVFALEVAPLASPPAAVALIAAEMVVDNLLERLLL